MSDKITPNININNFVLIPATGSHVYISKTCNHKGDTITDLTGYDSIRMAQSLGLNITSSSEWGKSREYFQRNPGKVFAGRTGADIEKEYTLGELERTSTLLAFRADNGDFPEDVLDLLKEAGFDGRIALIDLPYVQEKADIFIPSPRTRIADVSGRLPLVNDYIQTYDEDLGIPTKVSGEPKLGYHGAYFWIVPEGTRQIIRSHWNGSTRFNVYASLGPSSSRAASRLSSGNEHPSPELEKARILTARKELVGVCEKYGINPDAVLREIKE